MMWRPPWWNTAIPTNAIKGEDEKTYYKHINTALEHAPQLTIDDGADLVTSSIPSAAT